MTKELGKALRLCVGKNLLLLDNTSNTFTVLMQLTLDDLMEKEKFALEDLNKNRLGKTSSKQKKSGIIGVIFFLPFSLWFFFLGISFFFLFIKNKNSDLIMPTFFSFLWALTFLYIPFQAYLPILLNKVRSLEGKIEKKHSYVQYSRLSSSRLYYIEINKITIHLGKELFDAIQIEDSYKVYYFRHLVFPRFNALSLEPV